MLKEFFFMKTVAAVTVFTVYILFALVNSIYALPEISKNFSKQLALGDTNLSKVGLFNEYIGKIDYEISENVYKRHDFVSMHAVIQRILSKNEENNFEVVKDNQGFGHFTYFRGEATLEPRILPRVAKLHSMLDEKTKLLVVLPPSRTVDGFTTVATGLPLYNVNARTDMYIKGLKQHGIDYLDFREHLHKSGIEIEKFFFKADHHWTIESAFWAYTEMARFLQEKYAFPLSEFYLDKENYNCITYRDTYLGSMGRKTGPYYLGVDNFTLIYPKFSTNYTNTSHYTKEFVVELKGRFEDVLIDRTQINDYHRTFDKQQDKYSLYLTSAQFVHLVNKDKPDAPKAVFIKDSFGIPVSAFMSTMFSEIWLIDPRYYEESIENFVVEKKPDYLFLFFSQELIDIQVFTFCEEVDEELMKGAN